MGRILAVDYGAKRTGLAWTDPLQIIATGIGCIDTPELEKKLATIMQAETIEAIVLGYPTRNDGSDTHATPMVRAFQSRLKKLYPHMPVHLWDERFTSSLALDAMIQGGVSKKKRSDKRLINEVSATIILQEYIANH